MRFLQFVRMSSMISDAFNSSEDNHVSKVRKQNDGYPFDTGDWARWNNLQRLKWQKNTRDQLKKDDFRLAKKYGLMDRLDQIDKDIAEMENIVAREQAMKAMQNKAPADPFSDIDDTALKQAFASGDEAAVEREWTRWIAKLEAKAAADPKFAEWFHEFCKDQEILLHWDDAVDENE